MQIQELAELSHHTIEAVRAHYLRFEADVTWDFWSKEDLIVDESVGNSDSVGYRAGIA